MSKRMTRVLSLILTLVMFVSVSTPAFAWGGGDLGSGWDREIGEDEIRDFDEPVVEEEEPFDYFQALDAASGTQVTVEAPMGALPTLAELRAEPVEIEDVREAVESVMAREAKILVAMDISFWMNGVEIEPEEPVNVKISAPELADKSNLTLVHIPDAAEPETIELIDDEDLGFALGTTEIAFKANSFSVYAVVEEGDSGENARVEVNFFNGSEKIATMYVKNGDTLEELETILYDPGAGTIPAGQMFYGWTKNQNYTASEEDLKAGVTIDGVRKEMEELSITEGMDPINYYAMIFSAYNVTYLDELGVTIKTETLYAKGGEAYKDYEVNEPYTPRDQDANFEGWNKLDAEGNPTGEPIARGTKIDLTESIVLKAYVPKGNWLEFRENGDNVSYTAPQFLHSGEKAEEPTPPTRHGYTFGGWYYNAACTGDQFNFENTIITERTTLYAKWTPVATAPYTVIIWKQNVDGENYDFGEAITINGTVGDPVAVSQQGTGNNAYARINSRNYQYTGFHLDNFTQGVTVLPEGNAVVNVFYDRTEYTLTFQVNNSTVRTITAKYQEDISSYFPITGTNGTSYAGYVWRPQNSSYFTTGDVPTLEVMPPESTTFRAVSYGSGVTNHLYYYTECLPGVTGDVQYGGKQYEEHQHVRVNSYGGINSTKSEDFYDIVGFETYASNPAYGSDGTVSLNWNNNYTIRFYYNRESYTINYMDGEYVTGRNAHIMNKKDEQIGTSDSIYYNADISSYNKGKENYKDDMTRDGYVFEGWYLDETCTREADFTVMPQGGITVYAKWRQIEYRVFLHPNVPTSDTSFDMGGQATSFRVPEGGQINDGGDIGATRDEYTLIGWYLDEECTDPFNSSVFYFHESNTADYAQSENTELDKYGNPTETGNKDKNENRYWITHKLDLYAKWRSKLIGANGITVVFDAGEGQFAGGETTWTDPSFYLDQADCPGAAASAPTDNTKVFKNWVLYTFNKSSGEYEATETKVLPGETFKVLKANAKAEEITDGTQTEDVYMKYTVKLVAEYGEPEEEKPTSVTWYSNIQDVEKAAMTQSMFKGATSSEYTDKGYFVLDDQGANGKLKINEAIDIRDFDTWTYPGYKFLGWGRLDSTETEEDAAAATIKTLDDLTKDNLFLKYVEANGDVAAHFETTDGKTVTQIACDERMPHQMLVAVWEPQSFFVFHSSNCNVEEIKFNDERLTNGKLDITQLVPVNYMYGGYYKTYNRLGTNYDLENPKAGVVEGATKYEGGPGAWTKARAYTTNGSKMIPEADTTYFLKEVPNEVYLKMYTHVVYDTHDDNKVVKVFMITDVDDNNYSTIDLYTEDTMGNRVKLAVSYVFGENAKTGTEEVTINAKTFGAEGGYIAIWNPDLSGLGGNTIIATYTTPDGVIVDGAKMRVVNKADYFDPTASITAAPAGKFGVTDSANTITLVEGVKGNYSNRNTKA